MIKNKKSFSKNILSALSFCLLAANFFTADNLIVRVQAACGPDIGVFCNPFTEGPSGITITTISEAIIVVTLYLLSIIGLVALLFIVFAGIKYMTSAGDEEKMKSAKNAFYSAVLGLTVALMAYGILSVINSILNG